LFPSNKLGFEGPQFVNIGVNLNDTSFDEIGRMTTRAVALVHEGE
jgi:hypothetical protein